MLPYNAIIGVAWLAFIVVWLGSMFFAKRTLRRPWYQMWIIRIAVVVVVIVIVHYNIVTPQQLQPTSLLTDAVHNPLVGALGAALTVAGVTFAIWARAYLGRNWGMPQTLKENPDLITGGPYAYVRHPIYSGVILAMLGSACINWWWGMVALCAAVYFIWSAVREERLMLAQFGEQYRAYKARTKMLVPFIF